MYKVTQVNSYRQVCVSRSIIIFSDSIQAELTDREQALVSFLLIPTPQNRSFYSLATLASKVNCSVRTVGRVLKELRAKGLVSWKQRFNDSNLYLVKEEIKTEQNIARAKSFLKFFFAISFSFLNLLSAPKEASTADGILLLKGLNKNINHSTKNIVGGENYALLLETVPSWVHPPGTEFIRKRRIRKKEVTMNYQKPLKDVYLSGKKSQWVPDWIPLESEQVKAVRRDMLSKARDLVQDSLGLTFLKILQSGWQKEDPELAQTDIIK